MERTSSVRGVWIVACLVGAVGGTLLAGVLAYTMYEGYRASGAIPNFLPDILLSIGVAAASIVGLFRSRADIERDMQDEPVRPAKWVEEMRDAARRDED